MIGYEDKPGLHRILERGDLVAANDFIESVPEAVFDTNYSGGTALHVAASAGHLKIVAKLVNTQEYEGLLEMRDKAGYTALALVAQINGNTKMAKCMVKKKQDLLTLKTNDDQIPLLLASSRGHRFDSPSFFRNSSELID